MRAPERGRMAFRPRRNWLMGGLILSVYVAVFLVLPRGVFYSPDAGGKYFQMIGYHWDHGLRCEIIYPGGPKDPDFHFHGHHAEQAACTSIYPYRNKAGTTTTGWPPWFPLAAKPFHRLYGLSGMYVVSLASGLVLVALSGFLAERLRAGAGMPVAAVVGLASPVLFYSMCFWEHTLAVSLAFAAWFPLVGGSQPVECRSRSLGRWALAGILMLAACAMRRELVFYLGAASLVWGGLHSARRRYLPAVAAILLAVGVVGGLLLMLCPLSLRWLFPEHALSDLRWMLRIFSSDLWISAFPNLVRQVLLSRSDVVLPSYAKLAGWLGLACALAGAFAPRKWRCGTVLAGALMIAVPATWLVFTGVRYRALNSVILPAPVVMLAFLPGEGPRPLVRRWLGWTSVVFVGLFCLVLPAAGPSNGGLEWGSRYCLVAIVGGCLLGVVAALEAWADPRASRRLRWAIGALAAWLVLLGAASAARGVGELRQTRRDLLAIQSVLETAGDPVVTDIWWLGASLAPFAARHEIYTVSCAHPLAEWLVRIGPRRPRFSYVGPMPPDELFAGDGTRWRRQTIAAAGGVTIAGYRRESPP